MILFTIGLYIFWISADSAVSNLGQFTGVDRWLHHQHSAAWSFILIMVGIMARLIMMFFYFSLFKYLFLILGSPVFSYLSEKTESIIEGKEFVFNASICPRHRRDPLAFGIFWQSHILFYSITFPDTVG
jgi:CysZ protein